MNCPKCGADNPATNIFCDSCGAKLVKKDKEKEKKNIPTPVTSRSERAPLSSTASAPESPVASLSTPFAITLNWETIIWAIIFITGALLLFLNLGMKPLHHDESLHAFYAWELFQGKGYQYNPMMHGPFLFHFNALVYYLFGASDYSCRILPALTGMLTIVFAFLLRNYLGRMGAIFAGVMLAISPSFTYFGRFIRNDSFIAAFTMMMLYGMFKYFDTKKPKFLYFSLIGLALSFCTKEVTYITGEMFCVFLFFRWFWEQTNNAPGENVLIQTLKRVFVEDRKQMWFAVGIFFGITFLLYTTFLTNLPGFGHAFTKSLSYWLGQHEVQRGSQPVYFYIGLLGLYEVLPFIGAIVALLYYSFIQNKENRLWHLLSYAIVGSAWWLFILQGKETFGLIFSLLLVALGTGLLVYYSFATLGNYLSFLMLWTVAALSNYSFAGERMPWLILHPLLPMVLITGHMLGDWWQRFQKQRWALMTVFVLLCSMLLHNTHLVNFYSKGANPAELLVYVQSSMDVPQVVRQLKNMSMRLNGNYEMKITCEDYCSWPFAWYLRDFKYVGYPKYSATQAPGTIEENPVIITGVEMAAPGHDDRVAELLAEKYIAQRYKLRVWWAPDAQAFFNDTLAGKAKKAWRLFFYKEPWSGLGSYDMVIYLRKDVAHLYWSNAE